MEVNFEKMIETTTKFNELKKELDSEFYKNTSCSACVFLKKKIDELLILLDEMVRG